MTTNPGTFFRVLPLVIGASVLLAASAYAQASFLRGDANFDGHVDLTDPVVIVRALYYGQGPLVCEDAADANDDGAVDISDVAAILGYLYGVNDELAAPFSGPGEDPTEDDLDCEAGIEPEPGCVPGDAADEDDVDEPLRELGTHVQPGTLRHHGDHRDVDCVPRDYFDDNCLVIKLCL